MMPLAPCGLVQKKAPAHPFVNEATPAAHQATVCAGLAQECMCAEACVRLQWGPYRLAAALLLLFAAVRIAA